MKKKKEKEKKNKSSAYLVWDKMYLNYFEFLELPKKKTLKNCPMKSSYYIMI